MATTQTDRKRAYIKLALGYSDAQMAVKSTNDLEYEFWNSVPGGDPVVGGDLSGTASNAQIAAGSVGTTELANLAVTDAKVAVANKDGAAATPSMRTLGTGATQAAQGNLTELLANKGAANGYASLVTGKVPIAQLPTGTTSTTVAAGDDARFTDSFTIDVGDNATLNITVTHNLNIAGVAHVSIMENSTSDYKIVDVRKISANAVQLRFALIPALNQYKVTVSR